MRLLASAPELAHAHLAGGATRHGAAEYFIDEINHVVYAGDTALHLAAACYETDMARALVTAGASVAAANRRGAQPLHYAVDGGPGGIDGGADPNATNRSGSTAVQLAHWTTGRGGSGSSEARAQQHDILRLLRAAGAA